jgi:hypothetical protein
LDKKNISQNNVGPKIIFWATIFLGQYLLGEKLLLGRNSLAYIVDNERELHFGDRSTIVCNRLTPDTQSSAVMLYIRQVEKKTRTTPRH